MPDFRLPDEGPRLGAPLLEEFHKQKQRNLVNDIRKRPKEAQLNEIDFSATAKLLDQHIRDVNTDLYLDALHLTEDDQDTAQRSVLLVPVIFSILEHGERRGIIHDLCLDVATSAYENTLDPVIRQSSEFLRCLILACGSVAHGLPMSTEDMKVAQARLCACAIDLHLELPPEFQPGHKLYVAADAKARLLRERPLGELRPRNHNAVFARWLEEAPCELEQAAILCAWWISERHDYENRPIISLLKLGLNCNSAAQDIRRERGLATGRNLDILESFRKLHQELKDPSGQGIRISELKAPIVVRTSTHPALLADARTALSEFYRGQGGYFSPPERNIFNLLWQNFDALDKALNEGKIPQDDPYLNALQLFHATAALCQTLRAPGMRTPPIIELAAELSDLDPLWEWQFLHNKPEVRQELVGTFSLLGLALRIFPVHTVSESEFLLAQLSGNLFAVCRRIGIKLPREEELHQLLLTNHPQYGRASALLPEEIKNVTNRLTELHQIALEKARELQEALQDAPPQDAPPPALPLPRQPPEEQCVLPTVPTHVQEAKRLLRGRPITLLAGIRKSKHHEALEKALGVEVDWIQSDEYHHGLHAASRVKDDTSVVILGIRWMAHAHNGLRDVAREKGIPFVMHPGGLSPSSIAYQILQQAGKQLGT